ncbi:hypothetical protein KIN20_003374 [Parelaphostrongylus tenuis]|uniref:Uncharacterized protein n=1 Tax=Parelaphostrongylus tenuis TaxID=148309 RepID=A0AAD5LZ24_PARTN|nr:hypothetical protein KIN20_003374 [Parelaphostrongylus tenuis]
MHDEQRHGGPLKSWSMSRLCPFFAGSIFAYTANPSFYINRSVFRIRGPWEFLKQRGVEVSIQVFAFARINGNVENDVAKFELSICEYSCASGSDDDVLVRLRLQELSSYIFTDMLITGQTDFFV